MTEQALDDAITTTLAADPDADGFLTGWVLVTAETNADGQTTYGTWCPPGLAFHSELGLLHAGLQHVTDTQEDE